jgi:hypothetical protein
MAIMRWLHFYQKSWNADLRRMQRTFGADKEEWFVCLVRTIRSKRVLPQIFLLSQRSV